MKNWKKKIKITSKGLLDQNQRIGQKLTIYRQNIKMSCPKKIQRNQKIFKIQKQKIKKIYLKFYKKIKYKFNNCMKNTTK